MQYYWRPLLEHWSEALLASPHDDEWDDRPVDVIKSGWMGYTGATADQIIAAEIRIGGCLPPSYREFLKVSN